MICLTCSGASAGAMARPSLPTVALAPGASAAGVGAVEPVPVAASPSTSERRRSMSAASMTPSTADLLVGLELLDRLDGAGAELAVDRRREAGALEEVLEDLDVVAAHALAQRDAVAEVVRAGPVERTSKPPLAFWRPSRRSRPSARRSSCVSATPVGREAGGALEAAHDLAVVGAELPSVVVLKPACVSSVCSALTRGPRSPLRSVPAPDLLGGRGGGRRGCLRGGNRGVSPGDGGDEQDTSGSEHVQDAERRRAERQAATTGTTPLFGRLRG